PWQAGLHEFGFAGGPGGAHGGEDAAAAAGDFLVRHAFQPLLELLRAVAGVHQVGVAIDEAGRDPAAFAIDALERLDRCGRGIGRAGVDDESVAGGDHAVLDDSESAFTGCHRREAGIPPDPVTTHDANIYMSGASCQRWAPYTGAPWKLRPSIA